MSSIDHPLISADHPLLSADHPLLTADHPLFCDIPQMVLKGGIQERGCSWGGAQKGVLIRGCPRGGAHEGVLKRGCLRGGAQEWVLMRGAHEGVHKGVPTKVFKKLINIPHFNQNFCFIKKEFFNSSLWFSFHFRTDRTSCTMCYATDPTNNLGLGMDTAAAIQALAGRQKHPRGSSLMTWDWHETVLRLTWERNKEEYCEL